jgi:UDP-N-acetyl-D-galactosamine dehydrogenase
MTDLRNSDAPVPDAVTHTPTEPVAGRRISVIGLGYVGLPVAVAFARSGAAVVGYDIDINRIAELRQGNDRTGEVPAGELARTGIAFTADAGGLQTADFHIVAAPTPISAAHIPDLSALRAATATLAAQLKRGDIVVYESTVYPGATEEECAPLLEAGSGLTAGRDFGLAYSPERINPGDRQHRFETIAKVVAAADPTTLETVAQVYGAVVQAPIHRAPSIRAAEAAKVIENTQRDLNIALMNEFAMICARLGLDSRDVLAAAATKWNFLPFSPGLVGGHCVGVDPYYLTFCAERAGYPPEVILAGRRINDGMGAWVACETIKHLMAAQAAGPDGRRGPFRIAVLGLAFKEDVPDVRNSRVADLVRECERFGCSVAVHDPLAEAAAAQAQHGIALKPLSDLAPADAVILAVPHRSYREAGWPLVQGLLRGGQGVVTDVRGCLDRDGRPGGIHLWRV